MKHRIKKRDTFKRRKVYPGNWVAPHLLGMVLANHWQAKRAMENAQRERKDSE